MTDAQGALNGTVVWDALAKAAFPAGFHGVRQTDGRRPLIPAVVARQVPPGSIRATGTVVRPGILLRPRPLSERLGNESEFRTIRGSRSLPRT